MYRSLAIATLLLAPLPAAAAEQSAEAYIPFANNGGIQDWAAMDDKGIYIKDQGRQWYYATLFSSCFGLATANGVGFLTSPPAGSFDRSSAILVEGLRCPVVSLVKSDPPPGKGNRAAGKKPGAK